MKILFLGDIVGKIGRQAVAKALPKLKKETGFDLVMANVENVAHGKGVTAKTLSELKAAGLEYFTSGNHVWKKEEVARAAKESATTLVTPANDPRTPSGQGYKLAKVGSKKVLMVNLLGRVFIEEKDLRCPFKEMDKILATDVAKKADAIIVDLHAEATSEKIAMGWYLDGRVAAVLGTHTHVPTADYRLLPKQTAYVTDVGMVGPVDSVLGVEKEIIINRFLNDEAIVFDIPESGEVEINAVLLEVNPKSGLCQNIKKVSLVIDIS